MGTRFLELLLKVSEKAANIARVIRQEEHLFKLLVQEKKGSEKNPRFVQDFKTLADVLIQETVKHDVGSQFPGIAEYILGEESNSFTNIHGDKITVKVQDSETATAELLSRVLEGDLQAAELLAAEVHRDLSEEEFDFGNDLPQLCLPVERFGMWIDPIDSTAEYISGEEVKSVGNIYQSGLRCVTVLIGVYDRESGRPVIGVVNQPFHTQHDTQWQGKCYWGLKHDNVSLTSSSVTNNVKHCTDKVIVVSGGECSVLKSQLSSAGYSVSEASGAGYKQLCVMSGDAEAYILSKGTTFRWDTCGPHAILQSLGGGILAYQKVRKGEKSLAEYEISYVDDGKTCNDDGLIAFKDKKSVEGLVSILQRL